MLSLPTAFIAFVIGFGFLVFIHELGHFLVAKWVGIRCTQFALGFGPAICSWRKGVGLRIGSTEADYERRAAEAMKARGADPDKATPEQMLAVADKLGLGETEYRLNYLPLGGYVKMLGQEDLDPAAQSRDPRAFNAKSIGARFAVISAGVIMNLITGVIFFVIAFMAGVEFPPAVVGGVVADMPAGTTYAVGHEDDQAYRGLRVGDRITHIDGDEVMDFTDIKLASALGAAGEPLELTVARPGVDEPLTYRVTPEVGAGDGLLSLGILPPFTTRVGGLTEEDGPLAKAGVKPDMEVTAVAGEPVANYAGFVERVTAARGEPVEVTFTDPKSGESVTAPVSATLPLQVGEEGQLHVAGFLLPTRVRLVQDSPAERAGVKTGDLIAELGGVAWPDIADVSRIVREAGGRSVEIIVWRDGELVSLGAVEPENGRIGIGLEIPTKTLIVAGVLPGTPAATVEGLTSGSRLLAVNGQEVDSWDAVLRALMAAQPREDGARVEIRFLRPVANGVEETAEMTLSPEALQALQRVKWLPPESLYFDILREPVKAANPWDATVLGVIKTKQFIQQAYVMLLRLFQRTVHIEHLRGPVGILDEGTKIAQTGWSYLFYFLGLLSVNLAVINFLPIPIADGGHAVFLLAEKIKGSPVSARVQVAAMYIGLLLIGGVFVLVTYNDIARKIHELFG